MTKEPITFDKLPQAVSYLTEQVEKIYQLVETLQAQKPDNQHQLIDSKHSKKCTFYTLRFGCSFAAVNTIKPQLL